MGDVLWILPALGCGLMMVLMVVMMLPMVKGMFSGDKEGKDRSGDELRAEQERLAAELERLKSKERTPAGVER